MAPMRRFRPLHAVILVVVFLAAILGADRLISGNSNRYERVRPDPQGNVRIAVGDLEPNAARFYRFLNSGSQEVRFLVGRDDLGELLVAFDASENDFKMNRGFRVLDGWVSNNKCDTSFRLGDVMSHPSNCAPTPVRFRVEGDEIVLAENDLLAGWRYFR